MNMSPLEMLAILFLVDPLARAFIWWRWERGHRPSGLVVFPFLVVLTAFLVSPLMIPPTYMVQPHRQPLDEGAGSSVSRSPVRGEAGGVASGTEGVSYLPEVRSHPIGPSNGPGQVSPCIPAFETVIQVADVYVVDGEIWLEANGADGLQRTSWTCPDGRIIQPDRLQEADQVVTSAVAVDPSAFDMASGIDDVGASEVRRGHGSQDHAIIEAQEHPLG